MITEVDSVRGSLRDEDVAGPECIGWSGDCDGVFRTWLAEAASRTYPFGPLARVPTAFGDHVHLRRVGKP